MPTGKPEKPSKNIEFDLDLEQPPETLLKNALQVQPIQERKPEVNHWPLTAAVGFAAIVFFTDLALTANNVGPREMPIIQQVIDTATQLLE